MPYHIRTGHVITFSSTSLRTNKHGLHPTPILYAGRWYETIARCLPTFYPFPTPQYILPFRQGNGAQNHYNQSFPESRCPDCHDVWRWAIRHAGLCHEHLILHQSAQWKHQFGNLQIIYLCQKVGLVFHGIGSGTEPWSFHPSTP